MEQKIKYILSIVFEVLEEDIDGNFSNETVAGWDSLKQMQLAEAIEEEFNIRLTDDNIVNLRSYNIILTIVKEHC
ncbi:MAG: acyl carrier protein [Bacteriovorax sp.]|nr:acyl carrier protein [Bacteriovorax sp.]